MLETGFAISNSHFGVEAVIPADRLSDHSFTSRLPQLKQAWILALRWKCPCVYFKGLFDFVKRYLLPHRQL